MLVFLSVVVAVLGGIHFYLWARLVRDTQLPWPYRPWASAALIALAVSLPACFVLARAAAPRTAAVLAWPAFVWLGVMFLLLVAVAATDIVRLVTWVVTRASGEAIDPARRLALFRVLGASAGVVAGGFGAAGVAIGSARPRVRRVEITLERLPRALDGHTIVQLTDVHVGPTIGRAFIEDIVARTNALRPDVVAITGDLVDGSVARLGHATAPLADLRAKQGVYFVTGNHEFYSGVDEWIDELQRLGIRPLRNESVVIGSGRDNYRLAGVEDESARRMRDARPTDVAAAVAGRDGDQTLILLAHQPKTLKQAVTHDVCLQLSGHTHGGQIWPFSYLVKLDQPVIEGLARRGRTQIYVSPGTGYWGPPLRLGTRGEITQIVLRAPATA